MACEALGVAEASDLHLVNYLQYHGWTRRQKLKGSTMLQQSSALKECATCSACQHVPWLSLSLSLPKTKTSSQQGSKYAHLANLQVKDVLSQSTSPGFPQPILVGLKYTKRFWQNIIVSQNSPFPLSHLGISVIKSPFSYLSISLMKE